MNRNALCRINFHGTQTCHEQLYARIIGKTVVVVFFLMNLLIETGCLTFYYDESIDNMHASIHIT